jgi:DNA-binding MarR family transcriptional regulator
MTRDKDYTRKQGATAIGGRLRRLSDRIDRDAARLYADAGVEFEQRWFGVLNQLVLNGPQSIGQLAASLGITHASVSQTAASLQSASLIKRKPDPNDARSAKLFLSARGEKFAERLTPLWRILDAVATELDAEAEGIVASLDRLDEALDRESLYDRVKKRIESSERRGRARKR